jgi:hypothetical protein
VDLRNLQKRPFLLLLHRPSLFPGSPPFFIGGGEDQLEAGLYGGHREGIVGEGEMDAGGVGGEGRGEGGGERRSGMEDLFVSQGSTEWEPGDAEVEERGCPWDSQVYKAAVKGGWMEIGRWARERGCPWQWGVYRIIYQESVIHSEIFLEILEWIETCPLFDIERVFETFIERGEVEVLDKLLEKEGAPKTDTRT